MKELSKMSKKELIEQYAEICDIMSIGCYGTHDVRIRYALEAEIQNRGLTIRTKMEVC